MAQGVSIALIRRLPLGTVPQALVSIASWAGNSTNANFLQSWVTDVPVPLEERSDVQGLTSPNVPVNGPVERQLQRFAIERPSKAKSEVFQMP